MMVPGDRPHLRKKLILRMAAVAAALGVLFLIFAKNPFSFLRPSLTKREVARVLGKRPVSGPGFSGSEKVSTPEGDLNVEYSIDSHLQATVERTLKAGQVPYAAFVALDAKTGRVVSMVSKGRKGQNLALHSHFPAASIFKIVTAASALENGKLQHDSLIPVRGSYHTLYKTNLFASGGIEPGAVPDTGRRHRFARLISFGDAFGKSVNSVFGKVGIFGLGAEALRQSAERFEFGRPIPFELDADASQASIPSDSYELAESASGFNRFNTLNPVHGALIAAAIANEGVMMEPSIVRKITDGEGNVVYAPETKPLATVSDKVTADQLKLMMHRTITHGTSRGSFRGFQRDITLSQIFLGGKTGTLNGWDPPGRYDWFVGFAERGETKLALAALCVHGPKRGIKASQIARKAFETYFRSLVAFK